jgi:hypothetical protein
LSVVHIVQRLDSIARKHDRNLIIFLDAVNSRPMFTTHDRVGVYHRRECGGLSEAS